MRLQFQMKSWRCEPFEPISKPAEKVGGGHRAKVELDRAWVVGIEHVNGHTEGCKVDVGLC